MPDPKDILDAMRQAGVIGDSDTPDVIHQKARQLLTDAGWKQHHIDRISGQLFVQSGGAQPWHTSAEMQAKAASEDLSNATGVLGAMAVPVRALRSTGAGIYSGISGMAAGAAKLSGDEQGAQDVIAQKKSTESAFPSTGFTEKAGSTVGNLVPYLAGGPIAAATMGGLSGAGNAAERGANWGQSALSGTAEGVITGLTAGIGQKVAGVAPSIGRSIAVGLGEGAGYGSAPVAGALVRGDTEEAKQAAMNLPLSMGLGGAMRGTVRGVQQFANRQPTVEVAPPPPTHDPVTGIPLELPADAQSIRAAAAPQMPNPAEINRLRSIYSPTPNWEEAARLRATQEPSGNIEEAARLKASQEPNPNWEEAARLRATQEPSGNIEEAARLKVLAEKNQLPLPELERLRQTAFPSAQDKSIVAADEQRLQEEVANEQPQQNAAAANPSSPPPKAGAAPQVTPQVAPSPLGSHVTPEGQPTIDPRMRDKAPLAALETQERRALDQGKTFPQAHKEGVAAQNLEAANEGQNPAQVEGRIDADLRDKIYKQPVAGAPIDARQAEGAVASGMPRDAAKTTTIAAKEPTNAPEVRSNPRPIPPEGVQPASRENIGSQDIQQPAQARPEAGNGQERVSGYVKGSEPGAPKMRTLAEGPKGRLETDGLSLFVNGKKVGAQSRAMEANLKKAIGATGEPVGQVRPAKETATAVEEPALPEGESKPVKPTERPVIGEGKVKHPDVQLAGIHSAAVGDALSWLMNAGVGQGTRRMSESMQNAVKGWGQRALDLERDLGRSIKSTGANPDAVNAALSDPTKLAALPADVRTVVNRGRNMIDELSKRLISEGLINQKLQMTVGNNLGIYINKAYKAFDPAMGPKWEREVPQAVRDTAVNEFIKQGMRPEEAEGAVRDVLESYKNETGGFSVGAKQTGPNNPAVLKARQTMDKWYTDLLGPVENPQQNLARTVMKLGQLAEQRTFAKNLIDPQMGTRFFEKPSVVDGKDYRIPLNLPDGRTVYTDKAMANYLVGTSNPNGNAPAYIRAIQQVAVLNGLSKAAKTVLNEPAHAIGNLLSNSMWAVSESHVTGMGDPAAGAKAAMAQIKNMVGGTSDANYVARTTELGVINHGVHVGEVMDGLRLLGGVNFNKWLQAVAHKPLEVGQKLAGVSDDVFRLVSFENTKAYLKKLNPTMSEKAIEAEAAERVKNTWPTYSRLPHAIGWLNRNVPGVGGFSGYSTEIMRNAGWRVAYAMQDAKVNPIVGAAAFASLMATIAIPSAAEMYSKSNANVTDDEDEAFRKTHEFNRFQSLYYYRDGKDLKAVPMSRYDPLDFPRALYKAQTEKGTTPEEQGANILKEAKKLYLGGSPLVAGTEKAIQEEPGIKSGQSQTERRIKDVGGAFVPPMVNQLAQGKTTKALTGIGSVGGDTQDNLRRSAGQEALAEQQAAKLGADQPEVQSQLTHEAQGKLAEDAKFAKILGMPPEKILETLQSSSRRGETLVKLSSGETPVAQNPDIIRLQNSVKAIDSKFIDALDMAQAFKEAQGPSKGEIARKYGAELRAGMPVLRQYQDVKKIMGNLEKMPPQSQQNALKVATRLLDQIKVRQAALSPSIGSQP